LNEVGFVKDSRRLSGTAGSVPAGIVDGHQE